MQQLVIIDDPTDDAPGFPFVLALQGESADGFPDSFPEILGRYATREYAEGVREGLIEVALSERAPDQPVAQEVLCDHARWREAEAQLAQAREALREAETKSRVWHKLLQGQTCNYCGEPLLSAAGPACTHTERLQEAINAGRLARLEQGDKDA